MVKLNKIYMVNSGKIIKIISRLSFGSVNSYLLDRMEFIEKYPHKLYLSIQEIEEKMKVTMGNSKLGSSKLKM